MLIECPNLSTPRAHILPLLQLILCSHAAADLRLSVGNGDSEHDAQLVRGQKRMCKLRCHLVWHSKLDACDAVCRRGSNLCD